MDTGGTSVVVYAGTLWYAPLCILVHDAALPLTPQVPPVHMPSGHYTTSTVRRTQWQWWDSELYCFARVI